jgi:gluconate 2-dehydrogenase gamma chain
MAEDNGSSRRELLQQTSLLLAGLAAWRCRPPEETPSATDAGVAATTPKPVSAGPARAFLPPQRATLEAACNRILPSDADPGAKEADVIEYIDREVARPEYEWLKKALIAGVVGLDKNAARLSNKPFRELKGEEQDEVIGQLQASSERGSDFVKLLVLLSLEGFAGDPMYGGNKGGVGWHFVGYGPGIHEHH